MLGFERAKEGLKTSEDNNFIFNSYFIIFTWLREYSSLSFYIHWPKRYVFFCHWKKDNQFFFRLILFQLVPIQMISLNNNLSDSPCLSFTKVVFTLCSSRTFGTRLPDDVHLLVNHVACRGVIASHQTFPPLATLESGDTAANLIGKKLLGLSWVIPEKSACNLPCKCRPRRVGYSGRWPRRIWKVKCGQQRTWRPRCTTPWQPYQLTKSAENYS